MTAVAEYQTDWIDFSDEHERIREQIEQTIEDHGNHEDLESYAHAIVGVFGSGKTQFLYHIHNKCLEEDVLPIYLEAEFLFDEIFEQDDPAPGDVAEVIDKEVRAIKSAVEGDNYDDVQSLLNPTNKPGKEDIIDRLMSECGGEDIDQTAILVDELEQQYDSLQDHVRADERSPLRDWLERKDTLKFLALAPTGMNEMGNADQTRCNRLVIPPVDVGKFREKYEGGVGEANACWWLARGNPRHLAKNIQAFQNRDLANATPNEVAEFLRNLDPIGQDASQVPAAAVDEISREDIQGLIDLTPVDAPEENRYVVNPEEVNQGQFIENIADTLHVDRSVADYVARYFFTVSGALADENGNLYVESLGEVFSLAIDFLLEYQHNNPDIRDGLRNITEAYKELDGEEIHKLVGRQFEYKKTTKALPVEIGKIRDVFRLPIVDPIVRDNFVNDIREQWEGSGEPIWRIKQNRNTVYTFISERDLESFIETDQFLDAALPDGQGVLCLIADPDPAIDSPIADWLEANDKLNIVGTPPLLGDFLVSLAGELDQSPPVDLRSFINRLSEKVGDGDEMFLSRKLDIYEQNFDRQVEAASPNPITFCDSPVKHENVWGSEQQSNRTAIVPALAQAFTNQRTADRELLGELASLFASGEVLTFLSRKKGAYVTVARDLLPKYDSGTDYDHHQVLLDAETYFDNEEALRGLAQLVTEDTFRKMSDNENKDRLLTAFWRAKRNAFELPSGDLKELDKHSRWIDSNLAKKLDNVLELEEELQNHGADGLRLEDTVYETEEEYIDAHNRGAFERLLELTKQCNQEGNALTKYLYSLYLQIPREQESQLVKLGQVGKSALREMDDMKESATELEENLWEYDKAREYLETNEEEITSLIDSTTDFSGLVELDNAEQIIEQKRKKLDASSNDLRDVNQKLDRLENVFDEIENIGKEVKVDD